jgi:aryl-alcohol dehydrogenase-like predicted oxidoreductase
MKKGNIEYRYVGRTGLQVSPLVLGTMNFGPETSESDSFAIMDRALDAGINFFDTANVYGWKRGEGVTEQIVGRWLGQQESRRDQIVLATKVYGTMGDGPNDRGLSAYHVRRACEDSLERLQTDHIDIYQMHHVDRNTPWEEIWQAMEQLVREGKILYVGSSNFAGWHIARANETAAARNMMGLVTEQSLYNLAARTVEREVIPAAQAYGMGVICWSPLGGGVLAGAAHQPDEGRRASERIQTAIDEHREQLEEYEGFCRELGEKPAEVALAWLHQRPGVTAPIIGPRTMAQLESAIHSLNIELPDWALARLDEIWPGPGGGQHRRHMPGNREFLAIGCSPVPGAKVWRAPQSHSSADELPDWTGGD